MTTLKDDFFQLVEYAVKAPSGHNTQPWKFRLDENRIEILPDLSKSLPIVDTNNRELYISLGCAAENLIIAASTFGYKSEIFISVEGIISIKLNKSNNIQPDTLFDQINIRQANRKVYLNKIIADEDVKKCIPSISAEDEIYFYQWNKKSPEFETIKHCILKGNNLQMENKEFIEELKAWMRFNKKQADKHRDGLSYAVFGAPNLPACISKPIISYFLNGKSQNEGDSKKIYSSSHFILITSKNDTVKDWIITGRYLQRFLLKTTKADIAHAYMNQPCEVPELRAELKKLLTYNNQTPQILLRIGRATKTVYSERKAVKDVII